MSALALNRSHMHNKHMHVHCPRMLMWCSLQSLMAIKAICVCAVQANLSCRCLQTREIFKNTQSQLGMVLPTIVIIKLSYSSKRKENLGFCTGVIASQPSNTKACTYVASCNYKHYIIVSFLHNEWTIKGSKFCMK